MKSIIVFAVCFMLSAVSVSATKKTTGVKYGSVELVCDANQAHFGLSKNGKELLPARYEYTYNKEVGMFAFYAGDELYLYDTAGKQIAHERIDFPIDKDASVDFEAVKDRTDVPCFELRAYFFNSSWGSQSFGTFFNKGGHIYRIKRPKPELMN